MPDFMARLLGDTPDQQEKTLAILGAAGALSSGGGLLGAVQSYQGLLGANEDRRTKKMLLDAQIGNYQSEIAQRQAAIDKQNRVQGLIGQFLGDGAPISQGASAQGGQGSSPQGVGYSGGPGLPTGQGPAPGRLANMSPDQIAAFKLAGIDLSDIYKTATVPTSVPAGGYAYLPGQTPAYLPKPTDGVTIQNGQVSPIPGAASALASIAGAQTEAQEAAKARFATEKVYNPATQREEFVPRSTITGNAPAPMAGPRGNVQSSGYAGGSREGANAESLAMMQRELQNPNLSPQDRQAVQREMIRLQQQTPGVQGNFAAGPSANELTSQEANKKLQLGAASAASNAIETSLAGAQSASGTLQNVQQIRSGLDKAFLGPGANARVVLAQFGQVLGVSGKDDAERLINTRNVIQGLARQELSAAGSMKGQGQITENERSILRRAEAGDIKDFTRGEVETLLGALERTANHRISSHQSNIDMLKNGASPADFLAVSRVQSGATQGTGGSQKANSSGRTITRTGTVNGRKVVQYSDGTIDYAN